MFSSGETSILPADFDNMGAKLLARAEQFLTAHQTQPQVIRQQIGNVFHLLEGAYPHPAMHTPAMGVIRALGTLNYGFGHWKEWEQALRFASSYSEEAGQLADKTHFVCELSNLMLLKGDLDNALLFGGEAQYVAHQLRDPILMARSARATLWALMNRGELTHAGNILEATADDLLPLITPEHSAAWGFMLYLYGTLHWYQGEMAAAHEELSEAINLMHSSQSAELAHACRLRGLVHWQAGRYPEAMADLKQSARLFRAQKDRYSAWWALGNLGLVYWSMGRLELAEQLTWGSIRVAKRYNSQLQRVSQVGNLVVIYLSLGWLDRAGEAVERNIGLAQQYDLPVQLSRALGNRGILRLHQGDYEAALRDLEINRRQTEQSKRMSAPIGVIYANLSRCHRLMGNHETGLDFARRTLRLGNTLRSTPLRILALRLLAEYPIPQRTAYLKTALKLSRDCRRRLDEAACWLMLAGLSSDPQESEHWWGRGAHLLRSCGAYAWLDDASPDNPPLIPVFM